MDTEIIGNKFHGFHNTIINEYFPSTQFTAIPLQRLGWAVIRAINFGLTNVNAPLSPVFSIETKRLSFTSAHNADKNAHLVRILKLY